MKKNTIMGVCGAGVLILTLGTTLPLWIENILNAATAGKLLAGFKGTLELISLLSAPILAFIAFKALAQVKAARSQVGVMRQQAVTTARRDAIKLAAEQTCRFDQEILPLMEEFHSRRDKAGEYPAFKESKIFINGPNIRVSGNVGDVMTESSKNDRLIFRLANQLERLAIYFATGIADERIAFNPLGKTYCQAAKDLMPFMIPLYQQGHYYSNTLALFQIWNTRLDLNDKQKQIASLQEQIGDTQDLTIRIVGAEIPTEDD